MNQSKQNPKWNLWCTAIHEAAHFTVNYRLLPEHICDRITIVKNEDSLGRHIGESLSGWAQITRHLVKKEIAVLYAGLLAEIKFCDVDRKVAQLHAGEDLAEINRLVKSYWQGAAKTKARVMAKKMAHMILLKEADGVHLLAKELVRLKTISGEEAGLIRKRAIGPNLFFQENLS